MSGYDVIAEMQAQLSSIGLVVDHIRADGLLHRCGTEGKENARDGAYIAFLDTPEVLWARNWRTSEDIKWHSRRLAILSPEQKKKLKSKQFKAREAMRQALKARHAEAAEKAKNLLAVLPPATNHPYLSRKGIRPFGDVRCTRDGKLVLPMMNEFRHIVGLQFIDEQGGKRFLVGSEKKGAFFVIPATVPDRQAPLILCEGYATGASLHMATGACVLVCFDCGNLLEVGRVARRLYPSRPVIIAADNDVEGRKADGTPQNHGVLAAEKAAKAINASVIVPPSTNGKSCDYNDLLKGFVNEYE